MLKMIIKCADISNSAKKSDIYLNWAGRVMEEFWSQVHFSLSLLSPLISSPLSFLLLILTKTTGRPREEVGNACFSFHGSSTTRRTQVSVWIHSVYCPSFISSELFPVLFCPPSPLHLPSLSLPSALPSLSPYIFDII